MGAPEASDELLAHQDINPDSSSSILLIHGAFSDKDDWDIVTPHLQGYHLLVPDLPGHGDSRHITPFSKPNAARLVAHLIRTKAKDRRAHIIGLSLGAHVAIELACSYPEVVDVVFVSGFGVFQPSLFSTYLPQLFWLNQRIENRVPRSLIRWAMDGTNIRSGAIAPSLELCRQICGPLQGQQEHIWPSPWPARTLIVAAGKGGLVPSNDSLEDAAKLAEIGQQANAHTAAYTNKRMRHPWSRQAPELFAQLAVAWFEEASVVDGFVAL